MHGTAFVPWIYITHTKKHFQWITNDTDRSKSLSSMNINSNKKTARASNQKALKLIRTTNFGQRHVCTYCGVVLTILYDEERKEYIWPTAASIYDNNDYIHSNSLGSVKIDSSANASITTNSTHNNETTGHNNNIHCSNKKHHLIRNDILQSVRHIYCQDNAIWYQIPKDGLPRSYHE
jgi:hypothetical protein